MVKWGVYLRLYGIWANVVYVRLAIVTLRILVKYLFKSNFILTVEIIIEVQYTVY